ncbi:Gfo/Idh/MocA family oxidoreductase [Sporichthya sp.]|uniref:Gfo/Idh/MocA family protein n=1 Tax=Sporichthya sp. TaxID=65475 RepID=UPI0018463DB5|nr:Gfo/Idh/MocA family oxidoreductase [Sporichthya sp.]MBA3742763.1 Gfo/Idh/MocA family oxidoreductase [Sporichthya sp.]
MRIGVAGVGRIGALHAQNLVAAVGAANVVVADADAGRAQAAAEDLGVACAGDVDAMLAAGVDGLVVATPTDTHAALMLRGVEAGIPVFCEKPVAPDIAGTRAVLNRIQAMGGVVQVGLQRRFDAGYVAAQAAVASGALGQVHTITGHTLDPTPPPAAYVTVSGGIFRDCLVHDLDILRWVSGQEVVEVYATGANLGDDYIRLAGDVDAVAVTLTMTDGSLAMLSASRYNLAGYDVRMEVRGHRDSVAVGLDQRTPVRSMEPMTYPHAPAYPGFLERFAGAYAAEMAAFVGLVRGGGTSRCTVADALAAFVLAEACEISRRERRPVSICEIESGGPTVPGQHGGRGLSVAEGVT